MDNYFPDFSHHDKVTSFARMALQAKFVVIKGTQRCNFVSPSLKTYISELEKYKIPYWIYTYLEKGDEDKQTKFLIDTCKGLVGEYFIGYSLDAEEKNNPVDILKAIQVVKKESNKVLLYTNYTIWKGVKSYNQVSGDNDIVFWEPRYGLNTPTYNALFPPHNDAGLHQFTEKGKVDYISGNCDLSRLTGIVPIEWFTTKASITKAVETVKAASGKSKTVKKTYSGEIPVFPKRGYYKYKDGMTTAKAYKKEIEKVQEIVNFVGKCGLVIDGEYGVKTRDGVKKIQGVLGVTVDGYFGGVTLNAALKHKA